jgi:hypothetical protein
MERQQSPSIWLPLVGMLALGPGAITFMFAVGEATQLNSDWVKISTPLLLIGAASFVWLLKIKLGTPGVGVGAAISLAAIGYAFFHLNTTIEQRVKWRASSKELSDTERFCEGKVTPNPKALPYTAGAANPVVFFGPTHFKLYEEKYNAFEPKEYQIENAAMVICLSEKRVEVEKCTGYTGGAVVVRERTDQSLKAYAIKTGELVFEKSFEGEEPRQCASTEQFYGKSLETLIVGEAVEYDVIAELGPLLKR